MRVEALIKEGELHEALLHLQQLTNFINNNEHGFLKLSLLYYQMGDTESSLAKIRECLKLDQDHKQCFAQYKKVKKLTKLLNEAQLHIKEKKFADCIQKLKSALETERAVKAFRLKIMPDMCKCLSRTNDSKDAIKFCSEALKITPDDEDVLIDRAEAYIVEEEFENAIKDYETAIKNNEGSRRLKDGLTRAKNLFERWKKRSYYEILGVKTTATTQQIKQAYRKLAGLYHPDRHEGAEKKKAARKFIEIVAAMEVLSDTKKREKYDNRKPV
ncbi:dnaJ homolog subfamily C member 3-like [Symsagittifera roscoffensis]|uniref:dnaJ homolog subfamily C member 3-like n=1 Tax=Symsagittifera roscoffensis TaxID=84072 RepID=UPI00307CABEB